MQNYDDEEEFDEVLEQTEELKFTIDTPSIRQIYLDYVGQGRVDLCPEYQRDFCWSFEKMQLFIDSIMRTYITPSLIFYKLSLKEKRNSPYHFECVDGQHRLTTIKRFIENEPIQWGESTRHFYWKVKSNGKEERVFYPAVQAHLPQLTDKQKKKLLTQEKLDDLSKRYKVLHRFMTLDEKYKFDDYNISLYKIECNQGLSITTKCDIFNRLQQGQPVASSVKLRNLPHPITTYIRENRLLEKFKENQAVFSLVKLEKDEKKSNKNINNFLIYFLIRLVLIADKKNLNINYLDLNIKRYIESDTSSVKVVNSVQENFAVVKAFIESLIKIFYIKYVDSIPEQLLYILCNLYVNQGVFALERAFELFEGNPKMFELWSKPSYYVGEGAKVPSIEIMKSRYELLLSKI